MISAIRDMKECRTIRRASWKMIAPCGMNCGVCSAHLRKRNPCPGCRFANTEKPVTRVRCGIKTCRVLSRPGTKFCFQCREFPCEKIVHLDERYRKKYFASVIDNLGLIRLGGLRKFLQSEKAKWTCTGCVGTVSVHTGLCSSCGAVEMVRPRPSPR